MIETKHIKRVFDDFGYVWLISGVHRVPTEADLEQAIIKMKDQLKDEPDLSENVMGRLLVKKDHSSYDVYVLMGSI